MAASLEAEVKAGREIVGTESTVDVDTAAGETTRVRVDLVSRSPDGQLHLIDEPRP